MTLLAGDLTTPQRVNTWMASGPNLPSPVINQLIGSMTALIYGKLNRARTYSQQFNRKFDGVGNMQIVLPDFPVTAINLVQVGNVVVPQSVIPLNNGQQPVGTTMGYGYRWVNWSGNLPGDPVVLEFAGGYFCIGAQNVQVQYQAGYAILEETWTVPSSPYVLTVLQPQGIWCRDNGVFYAGSGLQLTPVASAPGLGQYIPPPDSNPGLYTFSSADSGTPIFINYSFIPADLEEACIQMIAERYSYRSRIGELSKSLGGQETIRYMRGGTGRPYNMTSALPPEVMDLIWPYVSVIPPAIGAPV